MSLSPKCLSILLLGKLPSGTDHQDQKLVDINKIMGGLWS